MSAVLGESKTQNNILQPRDLPGQPAALEIEEVDGTGSVPFMSRIPPASYGLAVRGDGNRINHPLGPIPDGRSQDFEKSPRGHLPDPDGLVIRAGHEVSVFRIRGDSIDSRRMHPGLDA